MEPLLSRGITLLLKDLHGLALTGNHGGSEAPITRLAMMMRQLLILLTAVALATFQTHAARLDWLLDVVNNDTIARRQAELLVWDGVSHPLSATFEKVDIVDKEWPFYLFHIVISTPGVQKERDGSSYLVCFRLNEQTTEFRIVTVVQYASNPPTENEIKVDKRLNRWPVSPPWEVREDLPRKIRGSGLSIVLDECSAGSER